jgi:hypothetical protein
MRHAAGVAATSERAATSHLVTGAQERCSGGSELASPSHAIAAGGNARDPRRRHCLGHFHETFSRAVSHSWPLPGVALG